MGSILRHVYECFAVLPMEAFERRLTDEPDGASRFDGEIDAVDRELLALLNFNLGVEAGQIAAVAVVVPLLVWVRRQAWGARAFKLVLRGSSKYSSLLILKRRPFWTAMSHKT